MKTINWLKKNYPNHYKQINELFIEKTIRDYMINMKYKFATLKKDCLPYFKDTLFLVKRSGSMMETEYGNAIWDGCHDIYGLFSCGTSITSSGYHHVSIYSEDYYVVLGESAK